MWEEGVVILRPLSRFAKPLQPEELPVDIRCAYDFSSQRLEFVPSHRKNATTIQRTCLHCGRVQWIPVAQIRQYSRKGIVKGLCKTCGGGFNRGAQRRGAASPQWKGGKRIDKTGYVQIRRPEHPHAMVGGYMLEHRLVMESMIGRFLSTSETVHHKNGDRADNRPDNLELWVGRHSPGRRYVDMSAEGLRALIAELQGLLNSKIQAEGGEVCA